MQYFLVLFFLFQISKCYIRFIHKNKTKYCLKTCFPDDDMRKKFMEREPPLYTLIWYDCDSCKKLLHDMENLRLKNVYINGGEYFYENYDIEYNFNTPLLYKEDIFIGDNLFDIYAEIYREQ